MGAMCGKSKRFSGDGNRLNSGSQPPTTVQPTSTNTRQTLSPPRPHPAHPAHPQTSQPPNDFRQASAAAAEARLKATASRGTKGGTITKTLNSLPADGGRLVGAIADGGSRSESASQKPLVWD